ncbi:MAG: hypothetical protein ACXADO_12905, partial [Candidatus Thorarchaeota archaeon]
RHAVMGIQYGHTKLREASNRLTSSKRLLVSLRMANFLHYRWLEDRVEECQNEIEAVKSRVGNQAEIVAKRMAAETKGLIDYNSWTCSQFPFIEGVTNRITELSNQYRRNVEEALEPIWLTLKDLERQLEGLNYYRNEFAGFYETAELSVGELPVCALPSIRIVGSDFLKNDRALGTLYITNTRIVFIAETGRVRKKTEIVFDFPLIYLKSLQEDGRLRKRLVLTLKQGCIKISCSEQTKKVLPDFIEIARRFERYVQTDLKRVRKLEQSEVSVSEVRLKIEGLVYSLLSHSPSFQQSSPEYYSQPPSYGTRPDYRYERSRNPRDQWTPGFRDHLERTVDRVAAGTYQTHMRTENPEVSVLRRNMTALDGAIKETVHLLRNGRLEPEDFIRRYRGLVRDSYQTREQISRLSRNGQRSQW